MEIYVLDVVIPWYIKKVVPSVDPVVTLSACRMLEKAIKAALTTKIIRKV